MKRAPSASSLQDFKRRLAGALARSRLDYTDEIMALTAFWTDFHRQPLSPQAARRRWRTALDSTAGQGLKLEVVFPFCAQRCLYCFLGTQVPSSMGRLGAYVRELEAEMAYFSPAFAGRAFDSLLLGHGTPTLLSAGDLAALAAKINEAFRFKDGAVRGVECHPADMDRGKIQALREGGFNRISFGVESLDPAVLRRVGRGSQERWMVEQAVEWAREAGLAEINLDLVFGLAGDTTAGFLESFNGVAKMGPTTITVCNLTLTDRYMKTTGVRRQQHLRRMETMLPEALSALKGLAARYRFDCGELSAGKGVWKLSARGAARPEGTPRGEDGFRSSLLAVGLRARSHIFGRMLYQRQTARFDPRDKIYSGRALKSREEMAYHVLYALNLTSRLDYEAFRRWFGVDAEEVFAQELGLLEALGKIRFDAAGFSFLPVAPPERIFYAAVFLLETLGVEMPLCGAAA